MKLKTKPCKVCKTSFIPRHSFAKCCSMVCSLTLVKREKAAKEKAKEKAWKVLVKLKKDSLQPRSYWIKKAQTACNKFIRLRDKHEPCISCRRHHKGQYHAGHYKPTGSSPELRFHPMNIHLQCSCCNNYKSGNLVEYRIHLIKKIGLKNVEYLEGPHELQRLSIEEVKEIEAHYKLLIKEM